MEKAELMDSMAINFPLYITYVLFGLTLLAGILLPIIKSFNDPASLLKSGIGLGIIAVIFLIGYSLSGNEVTPKYEAFHITPALSQIIGGLLLMLYMLGLLTLVALVFSEVSRLFK